jgi:hypothetical protein
MKDFAELPEYVRMCILFLHIKFKQFITQVKEGVSFIFASDYSDVYSVAFPSKS